MLMVGFLVAFIGVIALIGGAFSKYKAGRIAKTPFVKSGDVASKGAAVAGDKGAISTEGRIVPGQLLTSPVTQTSCLFYETSVIATWKSGDTNHREVVTQEKVAAPFAVDDGTGAVQIDAGKGGDFDMKEAFRKKQSRGLMSAMTGRPLQFGDYGFTVPMGIRVGKRIVPDSASFEVTEKVLLPEGSLYVNGKLDEHNRIGTPSWTSLILSPKTRDELMAGSAQTAKMLLIGGAAACGVGMVVSVVGALMA